MNHSNRALYQASIWTSLDEQQFYPSPSDFGWKMGNDPVDGGPAELYFQKPLRRAVNCQSVDARKVARVVVVNVSKPIYHVLSSVVVLKAARTQILRNRATNNNHLRYLAEDVKN